MFSLSLCPMSVIQTIRRSKSILIKCGFAALICVGLYLLYQVFVAPTRIALINFPAYQVSNIALSSDTRWIKVDEIPAGQSSGLGKYDAILLFGPGLRLNEEQSEAIEKVGKKGTAVYTFVFSSGTINNHQVDSIQQNELDTYYNNRSQENYRNMLRFVRQQFDKKKWVKTPANPPVHIPSDIFFHLESGSYYRTADELTQHLQGKKIYHENAPRIAIVSGMTSPLEGNRNHIDSMITRFTQSGYNVYPIFSAAKRQELLESVQPDAVVYLPMGRLGTDKTVNWLTQQNIPLFCPLSVMQSREEWLNDPANTGVSGGYLTARIVLPEIDGAVDPLVISTQNQDENGYYMFEAEPERMHNFTENVMNYLRLKQMENKNKRLAVCYFKGPGQNALVAAGLEVAPSLYEFLKRLEKEGYTVTGLPTTFEAFNQLLQKQGSVLGGYAKGAQDEFMQNGNPLWISKSDYEQWANAVIDPEQYAQVVNKYGEAPGEYLSQIHNGEPSLAVACLRFGNIAVFPQPSAAEGDDSFQIVHGADVAPPHAYIAPYLWVQKGFKAHALIHFGTHGSLEFTPGKQAGLSRKDWADCLIGAEPHFYYYSIGNVGEAIIAKRRSHAATVSYLTPPFMESRTRGTYTNLFKDIDAYHQATDKNKEELGKKIKHTVLSLGLHRDLKLDSMDQVPYTLAEIERIENFAEEIANEKMTGALYTLGQSFSKTEIESTVIAMSADPLAYSIAKLDHLKGKISKEQLENNAYISRIYLQPIREKLKRVLHSHPQESDKLLRDITSLSREDIMKARAIDMSINPRQLSMSEMMAMAANSDSPADASSTGGEMKMPAGMPKIGKMPDWVKKRIEARKKAQEEGKTEADAMPQIPQEEKDFAYAVLEIERTFKNVLNYQTSLASSPEMEMSSLLNALNGGYIPPTPGGDVVLNPNTLPTGRNMYSINAEATPSVHAWDNAKTLVEATLKQYVDTHQEYPQKVSYTFWAGEFIETEGVTLAQALYMLGVEPVRDGMGRVTDIRLIPSDKLGRPRIDIVVQTSGQLRDLAASRLSMLTKAIEMASAAGNSESFANHVANGSVESERLLIEKGMSPREARELSTMRVFGGINGGYGTGITGLVEKGDAWEEESEIARTYLNNMGAIYGSTDHWGDHIKDLFEVALQRTDIVVQPRQSNTWGALSLDHVYEFMGGLNLTVRNLTGKDPEAYFSDYRNRHKVRMQDLKESIGVESRTTILNPEYLKEKMKGGATTAQTFAETFRNTYGWNVMKPNAIDNELWDDLHKIYVEDAYKLNIQDFFRKENPAALQEMTAVMIETARKGYWKASARQLEQLAELHTNLIEEFCPSCSGFVCDNPKLQEYIAEYAKPQNKDAYKQQISTIRERNSDINDQGVILKKEQLQTDSEGTEVNISAKIVIGIILLLVILLFIRRMKKR